jgi:dihydropteroate synthase
MKTDIAQNKIEIMLPRNRRLDLTRSCIMGILNVTPDSFSDGGRYKNINAAVEHAKIMIENGAAIIDIGGESSRPGSEPVSGDIEKDRVLPVIEKIREFSDIPISIDTTKSDVASEAIEAGADIINDISALRFDNKMIDTAVKYDVPVILMHMLGEPKTMQSEPSYDDCIGEVRKFLMERIVACVKAGIDRDKIIIDPGIGFGKRLEDNLDILRNLDKLTELGYPVLLGASRKSFIGMISEKTPGDADKRIGGSLAAMFFALVAGCRIIRVHDVAESVEALRIYAAVEGNL